MTPRELHVAPCDRYGVDDLPPEEVLVAEVAMEGREDEQCETTTGKGAR